MRQRLLNISSSLGLLLFTYCFYALTPYYQNYFSNLHQLFAYRFSSWQVLQTAFPFYSIVLTLYFLFQKQPLPAKSSHCFFAAFKLIKHPKTSLQPEEKLAFLSFLLKAFYAPLMTVWLSGHLVNLLNNGSYIFSHWPLISPDFLQVFNSHGFWFLLQLIVLLDVFFFTLGYLIELPQLKNQIRSVDPTLLGWAVALACYIPFSNITSKILGWEPVEFPQFDTPEIHLSINFLLLALMAVYTSASVALNFKASNLTHRGIVHSGPYRFIRHPAYTCKNISWWLAALPALLHNIDRADWWETLLTIASVCGWSLIYVLRALTEEDHLKSVDDEYDQYCQKVRYRFIPGIY